MMRFRAVQSGLKPSRYFALPFHHHPRPEASAASSEAAARRASSHHQKPPSNVSLHSPMPTFGGYITGKNKNFITELLLFTSFTWWWGVFCLCNHHFLKVHVFQDFPGAVSALVQPGSRDAPRRTEMSWQQGIKSELAPTGVNFCSHKIGRNDPSVLSCFDYPGPRVCKPGAAMHAKLVRPLFGML